MQSKLPIRLANLILLLTMATCLMAAEQPEKAIPVQGIVEPSISQRIELKENARLQDWNLRHENAKHRRNSGWMMLGIGAGSSCSAVVSYIRAKDKLEILPDGRMQFTDNSRVRAFDIVWMAGGAALAIWGAIRAESGASEMRTIDAEKRNWGTLAFAPVRSGRGWTVSYQRTF